MSARTPKPRRIPTSPPRPWTRADLARLPDDGNRYEVLDGALLVTPSPAAFHQGVATRLGLLLFQHCEAARSGRVYMPGAIPHGKSELQPDILVIPGRPDPATSWTQLPTPILVVEVLSDSTARRDLGIKRDAYFAWGVPEYWVVDTQAKSITRFRSAAGEGEVTTGRLIWTSPGAPDLAVEVPSLFL